MSFISKITNIKVISNNNIFLSQTKNNEILRIPVAHGEGNYFADKNTLKALNDNEQIILKYCDEKGVLTDLHGSEQTIAGISDNHKRIFGLMPHPERAVEEILGGTDGLPLFKSLLIVINFSISGWSHRMEIIKAPIVDYILFII